MRPIFNELNVDAEVLKCKECKNGKFYVYLKSKTDESELEFDIFSDFPYNVGDVVSLKLWKVVETKYYVKKDK